MSDADLDEAYMFSSYGSVSRTFVVDGRSRGSHWLEGPADGAQTYVCDVMIAGALPELLVRERGFAVLGDAAGPRVRCGDVAVDGAVALYTRAAELPRRLLEEEGVREALLIGGMGLRVLEMGNEQSRVLIERYVGADKLNIGLPEPSSDHVTYMPPTVRRVASRTASGVASAISASRSLVRAFDQLAARKVAWSEVALFEAGALDDESLARLLDAVLEAASWLTGHAARVGNGIEARLSLPFGMGELGGVLSVHPTGERTLSARLEAALPETVGGILRLSPEKGLRAKLRALLEHEVGDARLDDALLIEGNEMRLEEVRRAAVPFGELLDLSPQIWIAPEWLSIELAEVPFDARVADVLEACLEAWDLIHRHRAGPR